MNSDKIRYLLGKLQANPESSTEWEELTSAVTEPDDGVDAEELLHLLKSAIEPHRERGEEQAICRLLQLALAVAADTNEQVALWRELASASGERLFDGAAALGAYRQVLALLPSDQDAALAIQEHENKAGQWRELTDNYLKEAESAKDDVYRSSMLMRAAEMELRYGGEDCDLERVIEGLEQAVRLDTTNVAASCMLEQCYRRVGRLEEAARVLERLASRANEVEARVAASIRLARLYRYPLDDSERAALAYERLLRNAPSHSEAMSYLSELYSGEERWDELVALYEQDLKAKDFGSTDTLGDMLQIAMLHARKRNRPEDAEPWFERIRKSSPAHEGVLAFFRDYCKTLGDESRWMSVLQAAQQVMPDGKEKAALATELAELAERQENAQKAIEQYKGVLRQDPDNEGARESLKRLYKATQGFTPLVELLRVQLERTPSEDYKKRLSILREVASVYRHYVRSETSLVTVLHQIVQLDERLDENDVEELRELVSLYERLGRHRELLTYQIKLAEVTPDLEEKQNLYRSVARRWLDQFSNYQNATEAYEALLHVAPDDEEARERLNELYRKRRAWAPLFELMGSDLSRTTGAPRLSILKEMAQLASERLHRLDEAVRLYKQILDEEPGRLEVLDALEKHAERNKDWATLAMALERRVDAMDDPTARVTVLQKLGAVYSDHLDDNEASVRSWRRVLEISPGHPRALRVLRDAYLQAGDHDGLTQLYESQGDWDGLVEVLSNAADRATDSALKIDLSYRAAAILEKQLRQFERAFRSYERILSVDPNDVRAARALVPIYETEEKWARLPALYELLLNAADTNGAKLEVLEKLVTVTGQRLLDRRAAASYARRAWEIEPSNESAIELFESSTRAAGTWDAFLEALQGRLVALPASGEREARVESTEEGKGRKKGKRKGKRQDAESDGSLPVATELGSTADAERRSLEMRLANIQATELGRIDEAVVVYKQLLARRPSDAEAAGILEDLLRAHGRKDDLRWLFEHRVQAAEADEEKLSILLEWARTEQEGFNEPELAIDLYRRALQVQPEHRDALVTLAQLLMSSGQVTEAASVMERQRDLADGAERVELELALAEIYLTKLDRPQDALDAAVRVLDTSGGEFRALNIVERLLDVDSVRQSAAQILAIRFPSSGSGRREAQALGILLEAATAREDKLGLVRRLADLRADRLGEQSAALDVVLRSALEYPDEIALWDRAEQLALVAGRPTDLAEAYRGAIGSDAASRVEMELCERAARLHEERLGDPMGATPYLERLLVANPNDEHAFMRLKAILTAAERWGELESTYERAIDLSDDRSRRVEMLIEVALIAEEIVGDAPKAIRHYERILELDQTNSVALLTLDRLYTRQGLHEPLAGLLQRRLGVAAEDEEIRELKQRLAVVLLDRLHRPDEAVVYVEEILSQDANDYEARMLAERILGIGSLRGRMARTLQTVYEVRDEIRDLVRVLTIRLECLDSSVDSTVSDERLELLRRIAQLRDERLHDDEGAFEVFARLVPLDPADVDARSRTIEIGRRLGQLVRVVGVLAQALDQATEPTQCAEIGMQMAELQRVDVGDLDGAEQTYRRVADIDRANATTTLPAARALEQIYVGTHRSLQLAQALRLQVGLVDSSEERKSILTRLGQIQRDDLNDLPASIAAYQGCLTEDPADTPALEALDVLYERTEQFAALAEILERRCDVTVDGTERHHLAMRRARLLADRLSDLQAAVVAWRAILDEFGPDEEAFNALESLFEAQSAWQDLASTLERHLDAATADATRLSLYERLGDVRRRRLGDSNGALDAYRHALDLDATHAASRAALEKMLLEEDLFVRREAAAILHPVYEAEGNAAQLLHVLQIEVDTADEPGDRLQFLEQAVNVSENQLQDPVQAFGYATRATKVALGHLDLQRWLDHLDRLAQMADLRAKEVELLREIVGEIFEGDVQVAVTLKIATMARDELHDSALARSYYEKALQLRPDDPSALVALEALHEQAGDHAQLLEVLSRRVEVAESDEERRRLMFRQAALLSDRLGESGRAVEVYERILDLAFDPVAIEALDRLYRQGQRWDELIQLLQRQLDLAARDKATLLVAIAEVYFLHMRDTARALDELELALVDDRTHEGAIALLERILNEATDVEQRARAAAQVEPVYLMRGDLKRVMITLQARLEASSAPEERRDLLSRLAKIQEEQAEDYVAALETTALLFHEDPVDSGVKSELERLAKVAGAEQRLAEIFASELAGIQVDDARSAELAQRAGQLFEAQGDLPRALEQFRRALAFDPQDASLFAATDSILQRLKRPEERVELYRSSLEFRFDPTARLQALHVMAALERDALGRSADAIATLRAALEVDDQHAPTLDALTALYRSERRFEDLAELLLRRSEQSVGSAEATEHRLALAQLLLEELESPDRALDQLEEIVRGGPREARAIALLEGLRANAQLKPRVLDILRPQYEAADDWQNIIRLNQDRYELAVDTGERIAILRETAELYERRGRDLERARQAWGFALDADPDDPEVRSEFERLTEATGQWMELAQAYETQLAKRPDLTSARDLLLVLARSYDSRLDDPRSALASYDRLYALEPGEIETLEQMERLATLLSDWDSVVKVLAAKAELLLSDEDRAGCWRRIGEAYRDMLENGTGAIEAYERALQLEPSSAYTVDCLLDLLTALPPSERLVELLVLRVDLCGDDDNERKYEWLVQAAEVLETGLSDRHRAIEQLVMALQVRPGDSAVFGKLERLYEAEKAWPELLENLRAQAEISTDPKQRARLRQRSATILSEELSSFDEALEAYRLVLADVPDDQAAIARVFELGREKEELRDLVAQILVPVLTATGQSALLVDVLELRLTTEHDTVSRATTLREIARVAETQRGAPTVALDALLRAVSEQPEDDALHGEVERLAAQTDSFTRVAEVLEERARSTFEPELARDLYVRVGRIAEDRLSAPSRAVDAYRRAVEQVGDQPDLLAAIDRLCVVLDDAPALVETLERRAVVETEPAMVADLYYRLAFVHIRRFDRPASGIAAMRLALERIPDHPGVIELLEGLTERRDLFEEVSEILEGVYRTTGRTDRLAALFRRRVDLAETSGERKELRLSLAKVLEEDCGDAAAARAALEQGLADDPTDELVLGELERLAETTAAWGSVTNALMQALEGAPHLAAEAGRDLWVRAAIWQRDRLRDTATAERCFERAISCDAPNDDVLLELESLQRVPGRERDLIETLRRRAAAALDDDRRVDLYREAKELAQGLSDSALVETLVREVLRIDESNLWALRELTEIRDKALDPGETYVLLRRQIELESDGQQLRALRHRAASVAGDQLSKPQDAVELYSVLFEDDPMDRQAAQSLRTLLTELERYDELGQLLERLIEIADAPAPRNALRLDLARLVESRFDNLSRAIDLLEGILEEDPSHASAVLELSRIYEKSGADRELAELLSRQISSAEERGAVDVQVGLLYRLAEVSEGRLGDVERAISTYRSILELAPQNRGALDALARLFETTRANADLVEVLRQLVEVTDSGEKVTVCVRLADALTRQGDAIAAAEALARGLAVDETNGDLRGRLRKQYQELEDWDRLAALATREAELTSNAPDRVRLLRESATIQLERRHDPAAAAALLEQASVLVPQDRDLLLELCDAYNASGRGQEAAGTLERIVESFGGRRSKELGEIHRRLGEAYWGQGAKDRAREELEKAFRIEPGNIRVIARLAEVSLATGDAKRAQQLYSSLIIQLPKLDPSGPITKGEIYGRRGEASLLLGDRDKAKQDFERALQADSSLTWVREQLEGLKS